jgi:hypothetical protein
MSINKTTELTKHFIDDGIDIREIVLCRISGSHSGDYEEF